MDTLLIAVGPDESKRTDLLVDEADDLADEHTTIVLGHVFRSENYGYSDETASLLAKMGYNVSVNPPHPNELAGRKTTIRDIEAELEDRGYDVEVRGAIGGREEQLLELIDDVDADHLIVGGRKRNPMGKAVFGSLAQKLLMNAPCPVTLVREEGDMKKTLANALNPTRSH